MSSPICLMNGKACGMRVPDRRTGKKIEKESGKKGNRRKREKSYRRDLPIIAKKI